MYRIMPWHLAIIGLVAMALITFTAWEGVLYIVESWEREEYSYGYFVPVLIGFFVWQRKHELAALEFSASWLGIALTLVGLGIIAAGELATLYTVVQYGYVVTLHGVVFAFLGWRAYRIVMIPLALLFLAVPLPEFIYNNFSHSLQLISSKIGVFVIRQFGITVFLEGNVIQLADMALQVVEACSGLRYLFPLTAVAFMMAYIYRAPFWKRLILFLSAVPITILMNSFRIGLVGVTVEYWGPEMAEGILHDFEGWVIFISCLAVLLVEMIILNLIGSERRKFSDTFYIDLPEPLPEGVKFSSLPMTIPLVVIVLLVLATGLAKAMSPEREEIIPARANFVSFPVRLGEWYGRVGRMEQKFVDELKLSDYILADYRSADGKSVNLYSAYYESQRKGASAHSPRSCLPGDGWTISGLDEYKVGEVVINGKPLIVNRAVIEKGDSKQLAYYWFLQRGRIITNEYAVKWFLLTDSITRHRTDGALVRVITQLSDDEDISVADARLTDFVTHAASVFESYIPN